MPQTCICIGVGEGLQDLGCEGGRALEGVAGWLPARTLLRLCADSTRADVSSVSILPCAASMGVLVAI